MCIGQHLSDAFPVPDWNKEILSCHCF